MSRVANKINVAVVGQQLSIQRMFMSYRQFNVISDESYADIIVLPGGADINPGFYGQKPIQGLSHSEFSDQRDYAVWHNQKEKNKFFVGICRGGQFLNVMNGGKLWQHVNNHSIGGTRHTMIDTLTDKSIDVSSTHHQMMRPAPTGETLGIAFESSWWKDDTEDIRATGPNHREDNCPQWDTEIVWYKDTKSLCYQPHPEYGGGTEKHFIDLVIKLY